MRPYSSSLRSSPLLTSFPKLLLWLDLVRINEERVERLLFLGLGVFLLELVDLSLDHIFLLLLVVLEHRHLFIKLLNVQTLIPIYLLLDLNFLILIHALLRLEYDDGESQQQNGDDRPDDKSPVF